MESAERIEAFRKNHAIFFFEPYPWQARALEVICDKNTTAIISSNKIGKSALAINVLISWLLGYEPWSYVEEGGGVERGGVWYRESSLGIKPPVDLILTGEDWKLHIGRVLIPEIKKWAPAGWYLPKKNEQGVEYFWKWNNGSTLTLMSYSQDDDLFESFRAQGVVMDEPPPKSKYMAMSRGLLLDQGKTVLSLTPIKEAWILDEIVLSGRKDVGIVDGLKITDNPDLYKSDCDVLKDLSEEQLGKFFDLLLYDDVEKELPVSDKGARAERFLEGLVSDELISNLKILKFIKDIDPADVAPRIFGQFKSLVGRVLKEFDFNVHKIEPFDVPTDWPVTVMIDFHLSVPQAISYWTVNRQDVNYCIGETWKNLSAEEIGDDIVRKIKGGWNITEAYIDPLSKGDLSYMRNRIGTNARDTFSILSDKLSEHGVTLFVASKDKDSGIKNLQTWLKGVNRMPTMYVFDTCERFLFEVQRWVFDDDGKPAKDGYDHMCENAYRYTLTGTRYEHYHVKPLPAQQVYSQGGWMGK
ncbi:MAG: hypothetical protein Q7J27_02570 [Syntrophales bacterium]|nr:hypothetical protein [Syntrophales bacterium]